MSIPSLCCAPRVYGHHIAALQVLQRKPNSSFPSSRVCLRWSVYSPSYTEQHVVGHGQGDRIPGLPRSPRRYCTQICRTSASDSEIVLTKPWMQSLTVATSLYPLYILLGSSLAIVRPSSFTWFVEKSPHSYSAALGGVMLAMGLTMRLKDLASVVVERPLAVLFGCAAQYVIMPLAGAGVARLLGLSPEMSAGLILLSCCPGGTASNVVTLIADGDVPLSILMTICTTFAAVMATPLLTQLFAGAYVPVDVVGLASSTLQVVLLPVLLGAWLQSTWPKLVGYVKLFCPLAAVLISSLLSSSVFSANVSKLASLTSSPGSGPATTLTTVAAAVVLLHALGFLLGYTVSSVGGFGPAQRRAISIEVCFSHLRRINWVGMQNSSLGVVLATAHFSSPLASIPAALSGVIMNVMASALAVGWRQLKINDNSLL